MFRETNVDDLNLYVVGYYHVICINTNEKINIKAIFIIRFVENQ